MARKLVEGVFKTLDFLRVPQALQFLLRLLTSDSPLSEGGIEAATSVMGEDAIEYRRARIATGGILGLVFRLNKQRAFTAFYTVNMPGSGGSSRENMDVVVHELVHVFQFQVCGSIYIWDSLWAQAREGYDYGGWEGLAKVWPEGKHFWDYNREQQAQLAQEYYRDVVAKGLPEDDPKRLAYAPFIAELQAGRFTA